MAFTAPPPGSIAARPPVRKGGVRAADESPKDFGMRMSGRQASPPAAIAPPPPPSRRDNIIAARADGSFATKRDAFNAGTAQHGRSMDEAGNITGTAPQSTGGQLVPGRSTGSMVWKPNTPTATTAAPAPVPLASPAATQPAAIPTTAPAPAAIAPPPPPAAKAPASPAPSTPPGTGPLRPPATGQTTALMGRLNTSMSPPPPPGASPAQSAPAPAPAPATPTAAAPAAPVAQPPPPRKPGMINDGQGFKPASEVNAGLRAAQDARAAQSIAPPPPPKPATASTTPGVLNQAAVDAHWTPERRAASRKEEKRLLDEQEASRIASTTPKPKPKTDAEYAEQHRITAELAAIDERQKRREKTARLNRPPARVFTVKSSAADIPGIPTLLVGR